MNENGNWLGRWNGLCQQVDNYGRIYYRRLLSIDKEDTEAMKTNLNSWIVSLILGWLRNFQLRIDLRLEDLGFRCN